MGMEYKKMSIEEKTKRIIEDIQQEKGCNPVRIFKSMAQKEYISIHGPEHHILDGACILTAFYNAGGKIRLEECLDRMRVLECPAQCAVSGESAVPVLLSELLVQSLTGQVLYLTTGPGESI